MFEQMADAEVVDIIGKSARVENSACARRLAAIAELYDRRQIPVEDGQGRELWRIDPWEAVAAEVSAAQCITPAAAGSLLHNAVCLHERLPAVAAVFATGAIDYRAVRLIVARTLLALDPDVLAAIDADLAAAISGWGPLSIHAMQVTIDKIVERHDPDARRRTESQARGRHVEINHGRGTSYLSGELHQTDATLLDRRLTALAHTVCDNDPRTVEQRRADALGALAAGHQTLACACGASECPAAHSDSTPAVVIHVVAEASVMKNAEPGDVHGERPEDAGCERITSRERLIEILTEARPAPPPSGPLAYGQIIGGTTVAAGVLADLVRRGLAELRPLVHPGASQPEPRYRPSAALADFIRCRDLTCRFPGCAKPAEFCDIDHTVPYDAGGPTHASNLKLMCRKHHLLKTFWCGPNGWHDEQLPDGTVVWTAPSGHTYRTTPGSSLFRPTGTLTIVRRPCDSLNRGAMMPQRQRTRAGDRRNRVLAERLRNSSCCSSGDGQVQAGVQPSVILDPRPQPPSGPVPVPAAERHRVAAHRVGW